MIFFNRKYAFLLILLVVFSSCESEYAKTVKEELKSGVVNDALIFGMKMGDTQQDFFDRCLELNHQKKVGQGLGRYAQYTAVLDSTEAHSAKAIMLFYGIFDEEKIMHGMEMKFSYVSWAPWNKDYQADKLVQNLQRKYLKEYPGNDFIEIEINEEVNAFSKIDGNRQLLIYPLSDKDVVVKMTDLRQIKNLVK